MVILDIRRTHDTVNRLKLFGMSRHHNAPIPWLRLVICMEFGKNIYGKHPLIIVTYPLSKKFNSNIAHNSFRKIAENHGRVYAVYRFDSQLVYDTYACMR